MWITNKIQTPDGTILTSHHRHDYVTYTDKNGEEYMVDGGHDYLRRNVNKEKYTDLSVKDDGTFESRRNLEWGKNYDKEGNRLPKPIWIPIKDLTTDHIKAIIENVFFQDVPTELTEEHKYSDTDIEVHIYRKTMIQEYLNRIKTL